MKLNLELAVALRSWGTGGTPHIQQHSPLRRVPRRLPGRDFHGRKPRSGAVLKGRRVRQQDRQRHRKENAHETLDFVHGARSRQS